MTVRTRQSSRGAVLVMALILLAGSVIGAQIGARVSEHLKGDQLKILLAIIVLIVCAKMLLGFLLAPDVMISLKAVE